MLIYYFYLSFAIVIVIIIIPIILSCSHFFFFLDLLLIFIFPTNSWQSYSLFITLFKMRRVPIYLSFLFNATCYHILMAVAEWLEHRTLTTIWFRGFVSGPERYFPGQETSPQLRTGIPKGERVKSTSNESASCKVLAPEDWIQRDVEKVWGRSVSKNVFKRGDWKNRTE